MKHTEEIKIVGCDPICQVDQVADGVENACLERAGLERIAHRRRVAELCRRTARCLGVKGPVSVALVLAATEHRDGIRQVRGGEPARNPARLEESAASFESLVAEMTETILRCRQGMHAGPLDGGLELAVEILEACDEFDDAVESSALEGISISAGIDEFFDDAAPRLDPRILLALRQTTSPAFGRKELLPIVANEMPELPEAAIRLMRTSDDSSVEELEAIAASDPGLAGRLIRTANSRWFGSGADIRQLKGAIVRVGVPFARKVLLAACVGRLFGSRGMAGLWEHSMKVAVHAHELAAECGYDRDVAYVAGMMHDIGRLVTHRCPGATRLEEESLLSAGFPLTYAECLIYGTDHAAIGSDLVRRWNLPREIAEGVAFHHSPENTTSVLGGLLNLAEEAALMEESAGMQVQSEAPWRGMRHAAAARLTGIHGISAYQTEEKSAIWSLAS